MPKDETTINRLVREFHDFIKLCREKPFIAILVFIALILFCAYLFRENIFSLFQTRQKQATTQEINISTGDQSPVYQAGRDLTINFQPISKDIKTPEPLGIFEFDSNYKRARSYMLAGDYKKAADLFKPIYEKKPDYPTLALYYGDCLARIENYEEALPVWLSIPQNEKYIFKNINTANLLYNLKRYKESVKYYKLAMNDFKRNDCRYWNARALLIIIKNKDTSLEHLINDVNEFTEVVDNDVRNISKYEVKEDTAYEIDKEQTLSEILGRNSSAFKLLWIVSYDLQCKENIHSESLNYALRAAEHLFGPVFGCPIAITNQQYIEFLQHLSSLLCYCNKENIDHNKSKLNSIMEKIEKHNRKRNPNISDFAMLIRSFHGDSESIRPVTESSFEITYVLKAEDTRGLKSFYIESSNYLLGRKKINIEGKKEYLYEKVITINPEVHLKEKPFFRITVENINGISLHNDPCPWIKIIE